MIWPRARTEPLPRELHEPPRPERPVVAVGDIHGCSDKLDRLLDRIAADPVGAEADLVFLGDYVDRGPDSAGVLRRLRALQTEAPARVTCLVGNHDWMMLDFLDGAADARLWLQVGGAETLASFGVGRLSAATMAERVAAMVEGLREALEPELEDWLRGRPLWWRSGTLVAVHALTDPALPMEAQDEETLLWARPSQGLRPRDDGAWVVHGHTIMREPRVKAGHVAIDTGAFRGGPLTAAVFDGGPPRFIADG